MKRKISKILSMILALIVVLTIVNIGIIPINAVQGSDYTNSSALASKLDEVFAGDIDLYDTTSGAEVYLPLGSYNMFYSRSYKIISNTTGSSITGKQCYAYANAVYNKIYNEWVGSGKNGLSHSENVIPQGTGSFSYDLFCSAGVLPGAIVRTTPNSDGRWNGDEGHSFIIISYNTSHITYIEGNADYQTINGDIMCLNKMTTRTWQNLNSNQLTSRGRVICYVIQPTKAYYQSLYGSVPSTPTPPVDSTNPDNYPVPTTNYVYKMPNTRSEEIKWIQAVLCKLGYSVVIDGAYGQGTAAAITAFQQNYGIGVDGKCGPETRRTLEAAWNNYKNPPHTHSYGAWQTSVAASCTTNGSSYRTCSCGDTQTRTDSALGHIWNSGVIVTNSGCTSEGLKKYTCSRCGATTNEVISAKGHTAVKDNAVEATCTETGLSEGSHCSVCNATIKEQQVVPALGHDFKIVSVKQNCDSVIATYKCSRCEESYTGEKQTSIEFDWSENKPEGIDDSLLETKTLYSFRDKSTTTSGNSSLSGWTQYKSSWAWSDFGAWSGWSDSPYYASDYRQVDSQTVVASYNYKTVWHYYCYSKDANLSGGTSYYPNGKYGYNKYSFDFEEELSPTGKTYSHNGYTMVQYKWWYSNTHYHHVYAVYPGEAPYQYTTQEIASTNYKTQYRYRDRYQIYTYYYYKWSDWSDWSETVYTGNDNREVKEKTLYKYNVLPTGHSFSNEWELNDDAHWHKCDNCNEIRDLSAHSYGEWIKSTDQENSANEEYHICTDCGHIEKREIDVCVHNFIENVDNKYLVSPATCTSPAVYYKSCDVCGETSEETFENGDPLSHTLSNIWENDREKHWHICTECGEVADTAAHVYDNDKDTNCNICGYVRTVKPEISDTDTQVTVSSQKAKPGEEVKVIISLKNAPEITSMMASDIIYNSNALTLKSAKWLSENPTMKSWNSTTQKGVIGYENATDLNGDTLELTFIVNETAAEGDYTIGFTYKITVDGEIVEVPVIPGTVTVKNYVTGDINGDEKVTDQDAIYLLFNVYFADEYPLSQPCDFNKDGKVTDQDAIYLLFHVYFADEYPIN